MSQGRIKLLIAGIVSLLLLSSFSCWRIFRDGWRIDAKIETYQNYNKSAEEFQELILLIRESNQYTSSRVFLAEDKDRLVWIHAVDYPALKGKIESTIEFRDDIEKKEIRKLLLKIDTLVSKQEEVIKLLLSFKDYGDPAYVEAAKKEFLNEVITPGNAIVNELTVRRDIFGFSAKTAWQESRVEIESADEVSLLLSILMLISGILGLTIIISGIRSPDKSMI